MRKLVMEYSSTVLTSSYCTAVHCASMYCAEVCNSEVKCTVYSVVQNGFEACCTALYGTLVYFVAC